MDTLKNESSESYNYTCRYTGVNYYYDSLDDRQIYGIGKNMTKDTAYATHAVQSGDTLDTLALKYYANPSYWWIIAYFNDIQDSLINLSEHYKTLKIPSISSINFGELR